MFRGGDGSLASPREDIAAALESKLSPEQVGMLVDEVLAIKKGARGWCPSCKKHVQVEISDAKAVVSAMTDLLSQAYGRPKEQERNEQPGHGRSVLWSAPNSTLCD